MQKRFGSHPKKLRNDLGAAGKVQKRFGSRIKPHERCGSYLKKRLRNGLGAVRKLSPKIAETVWELPEKATRKSSKKAFIFPELSRQRFVGSLPVLGTVWKPAPEDLEKRQPRKPWKHLLARVGREFWRLMAPCQRVVGVQNFAI